MTGIRLRPVLASDLDTFFEHQRDPVALRVGTLMSRERPEFDTHWARILADPLGILRTVEGEDAVFGYVGSFVREGLREVAYWYGREHWGKGIATEALSQLLAEVHERLHDYDAAAEFAERAASYRKESFELAAKAGDLATKALKKTMARADKEGDAEKAARLERELAEHETRDYRRRVTLRPNEPALRLESFNDDKLKAFRFGPHEAVQVTGALGEPVQMWLIYPPHFDPKKKYPLLHSIHGGPHAAAGDTFHYRWNNHVFAAQGYVVACVNYHGSSGFGYAFLDSITHRWGELELQDVEAATDWLVKQPWVDRKRVFATGGSYGGYMVAWMNGHVKPGRYQAYVCHAGCFDWTAMFSDDAFTWHAKDLGAWYWDDIPKIHAQSPHAFARHMKTPTLVIHGALDYRVPDQQGLAYYNTLKARSVDARLVWFPDENHWILKPRNSRLWYGEFFSWLKKYDPAAGRTKKLKAPD